MRKSMKNNINMKWDMVNQIFFTKIKRVDSMQRSVETKAIIYIKPQCFAELLLINSGAPVIIKGAFQIERKVVQMFYYGKFIMPHF